MGICAAKAYDPICTGTTEARCTDPANYVDDASAETTNGDADTGTSYTRTEAVNFSGNNEATRDRSGVRRNRQHIAGR